ncbi:hypothetical protein 8014-B2_00121 [Lactobacillus phage ATCC 8014-B2]|uniref:Uncharacterized protein n=1 Tax=Lactobacillus phage ATCC 8014-B2 TaxID=1225795 RepID=K4I0M1_9CAUD|nr:hypothetical protein HOQ89_gp025 [Lactobacillus phage ATCC 8014-B2]AFU63188.1 hypothetical protein 8014-B2_00121 [Lactobacillus phage ATCC 8014-B2]
MTKDELMQTVDEMKEMLGTEEFLQALIKLMSSDELCDNLDYINSCYDLDIDTFKE